MPGIGAGATAAAARSCAARDPGDGAVLLILMALMMVNMMDRQILAESIRVDLALSDTQLGVLSGLVFSLFYATLGLPIGRLADRADRVHILAAASAVWSLMTAACGLASTFTHMAVARIGVAAGEAGGVPPAHSLIAERFPPERRGRAMATMQIGAPVGVIVAFVAGGWIAEAVGWRAAFIAAAVPGLLVALAALLVLPEPRRGLPGGGAAQMMTESFRQSVFTLLRDRRLRLVLAGGTFAAFAIFAFLAWVPVLFQRVFGWTPGEVGARLGPVLGLCGVAGTWLGGTLGDRLQRHDRGGQIRVSWLAPLAATPPFVAATLSDGGGIALAMLSVPALLYTMFQAPLAATVQTIAPPDRRALASSVLTVCLNLLGLGLGPTSVGLLSDALSPDLGDESLRYALLLVPAAGVASAWFLALAHRQVRQGSAARIECA